MGAGLPKPVCSTVLERHDSEDFRVGLAELNGWRGSMEDAHVVHLSNGEGFFGILDGHGGQMCSAWCAKHLREKLAAHGCPRNDTAAKKLVLGVDKAYLRQGDPSGSTAAMCVVRRPASPGGKYKLHVINAGDSRVLLSRADGTIVDGGGTDGALSTDHKPEHPMERERIERCGGTVELAMGDVYRVNGVLSVSRGFGDAEFKKTGGPAPGDRPVTASPEMGHFECDGSDFLLLVCDGVSEGTFPNAEVCQLAARVLAETHGDAAKAAEAVIFRALNCESKDNISCMIVLLGGAQRPTASPSGRVAAGGAPPIGCIEMGASRWAHRDGHTWEPGMRAEFWPGSLLGCEAPQGLGKNYLSAYIAMCERGGVSLAQAAETRYYLLAGRHGTADAAPEDLSEMALIHGMGLGAPLGARRKEWFEAWAQACKRNAGMGMAEVGGSGSEGGHGRGHGHGHGHGGGGGEGEGGEGEGGEGGGDDGGGGGDGGGIEQQLRQISVPRKPLTIRTPERGPWWHRYSWRGVLQRRRTRKRLVHGLLSVA